ncbi:MAG: proline dehydrogenase family protein [Candidatus Helarchaeota archaeon]|nr:proline dehydrogenase family protein [Candidatus Helarchaeota archaeon]
MILQFLNSIGDVVFSQIIRKWVAGSTRRDIIEYTQRKNMRNVKTLINYLGEHHKDEKMVTRTVDEYGKIINEISNRNLNATISIKLSQLGFDVKNGKIFCKKNVEQVISTAHKNKVFTWIDTESLRFVDFTFSFYKELLTKYNCGLTLQANFKRTMGDLKQLIELSKENNVYIRLVKGIYDEPAEYTYQDFNQIEKVYLDLISTAFKESSNNFGIAIASHSKKVIEEALRYYEQYPKDLFEMQFLKGVRTKYAEELIKKGVPLAEYVPYGEKAFAYTIRRARKNPKLKNSLLYQGWFILYDILYPD